MSIFCLCRSFLKNVSLFNRIFCFSGIIPLIGWTIKSKTTYVAECGFHETGPFVTWMQNLGIYNKSLKHGMHYILIFWLTNLKINFYFINSWFMYIIYFCGNQVCCLYIAWDLSISWGEKIVCLEKKIWHWKKSYLQCKVNRNCKIYILKIVIFDANHSLSKRHCSFVIWFPILELVNKKMVSL